MRISAGLAIALMCSCARQPDAYPPPAQIEMPRGPEPAAAQDGNSLMVAMSDPDADAHILADVHPADDNLEWRLTGLHPRFRLHVPDGAGLNFYLRFFNHEEALRARGPVTFTVTINGRQFKSYRFSGAGDQEYRRPLPDDWIDQPGVVDVGLDIDPPWRLPDGTTYGVSIHSIGFERRQP